MSVGEYRGRALVPVETYDTLPYGMYATFPSPTTDPHFVFPPSVGTEPLDETHAPDFSTCRKLGRVENNGDPAR